MTIDFNCDSCGRAMRVKDEMSGKKGKCPDCGSEIVVPAGGGGEDFMDVDLSGYQSEPVGSGALNINCPMCGESISKGSTSCPACGENLDAPQRKKKKSKSTAGENSQESKTAMQIFVTGLLGCFSPIVLIYGIIFLMKNPHDFPRKGLAIAGTIMHGFWVVVLIFRIMAIANGNNAGF